ncbi:MAG: hypothetical protein ACR2II_01050 [Chthoniobacterales bacterium]
MKTVPRSVGSEEEKGTVFKNYVGIDIHKKYSVLCAQDEAGRKVREARIEGHDARD